MRATLYSMLIVLVAPAMLSAQKAKIKLEDGLVTLNEKPWALMVGMNCVRLFNSDVCEDYSFQTLDSAELIYFKWESYERPMTADEYNSYSNQYGRQKTTKTVSYVTVIFPQLGVTCEVDGGRPRDMAQTVYENELVAGGKLDSAKVARFVLIHGHRFSEDRNRQANVVVIGGSVNSGGTYETVERNRNASITVYTEEIRQDFKVIGTYKRESDFVNGISTTYYRFYLPGGTQVAEASMPTYGADKTCRLVTLKDNRSHTLTLNAFGTTSIVKEIAEILVRDYYL